MKKFSLILLAAAVVATLALTPVRVSAQGAGQPQQPAPSPHQVGLIDVAYIFENYEKFKDQREGLKAAAEKAQAQAMQMAEAFRAKQQALQTLTPNSQEYAKVEAELFEMQGRLQAFQQSEQRDIVRKQADLFKQVYMEVQKATNDYSKYYKYTLVLRFSREDTTAATDPQKILQGLNKQVVYYQQNDDITDDILNYLNDTYRKSANAAGSTTR